MKNFLKLLLPATSLLVTGCDVNSSIKISGKLNISINLYDYEIDVPLEIDSNISLNEGYIELNKIKYFYQYDLDTNNLESYFEYKGEKYPYNYENNSVNINGVEYYLNDISIVELQEAIQNEYLEKQEDKK